MQLFRSALKVLAPVCVLAVMFSLAATPANAKGTFSIQHGNGRTDTYKNVGIKVIHGAVYVTSADGKGTVVLHRAACSYQNKLLVCLPTSVTLIQGGKVNSIDLKTGTVYLNDTDDPQPLVLSSAKVPPHSIMMSFTTHNGAYVSLSGRIDRVVK